MSYIDIPLSNTNVYFELIDNQTGFPVVNPQFPIGIGRNFGSLYDLGCGIKIHQILSIYELCFSEVSSVTLCLYGTSSVGDMDVYITGDDTISDSPITPNTFDYVIPLEDTYDSTYCGYLFKMSTPNANNYSTFTNTGSYIRIEYNALESIYISNVPKRRYFNNEQLDLTNLEIKAVLSNNTEEVITNYTSSIANDTVLSPSNTSVTFSYTRKLRTRTCTLQIEVLLWASESLDEVYVEENPDPNQIFDIYTPPGTPPQNGFPVVVTIHGGEFREGVNKSNYNYITPLLISNGCVHVNMEYRLMSISNENNNYTNTNGVHYQDMLSDIGKLITYLNANASTYNIDNSKIALMGHSAGGNLALGYTLRSIGTNSAITSAIPVKLVITEGAVTFTELEVANNVIRFIDGAYVQIPNIDSIMRALLDLTGNIDSDDIVAIKPQTYNSINNDTDLLYLIIQGIGFGFGNTSYGDGDMVVPLRDAEAIFDPNQMPSRYSSDYPIFVIEYCKHWSEDPADTSYKTAINQSHSSGYYAAFNNIISAYKRISNNNNS